MQKSPKKPVKIVFILIDGIGDLSLSELKNLTILQSLSLPFYNLISKTGLNGLMDPVETGLACGSDTAHMNILGYNPFTEYRGRGSFETLGSGIPMDFNEIGFKCNFASMDKNTKIVYKRRVDREFHKWGIPLIDAINGLEIPGFKGYKCCCVHATEHRCAIKITGPNLSSRITSTDPLKDGLKLKEVIAKNSLDENAVLTASIVNSLSGKIFEILNENTINLEREKKGLLPANIILLRGCGSRLKVKSFKETHGFNGFMIAPTAIINGLGQSIYMDIVKVPGATGDYSSDFSAKSDAFVENIKKNDYDFGFLHIKAVDDAGHDKNLDLKMKFYGKIDKMIERLIEGLEACEEEYVVCLTGDHTTPIKIGDHTFEPVPFAITTIGSIRMEKMGERKGVGMIRDGVEEFNEISCGEGGLGRFSGAEVMGIIKRFKEIVEEIQ